MVLAWSLATLGGEVGHAFPSAPARTAPSDSYTTAADTVPLVSDLFDAPVYYERYLDRYTFDGDLQLLRSGRVRVQHYAPVEVSDFRWDRKGSDYTWWMQMQELRFLLPAIASPHASDRTIAKQWLSRWHEVHIMGRVPATKQGEPMTFAYRAMVFVYYLKTEMRRRHPDPDVVSMLRSGILAHQKHLLPDTNYDANNNHGMIDAIGLFETTRVFPNRAARLLAQRRIRTLVQKSVSLEGVHLEHSAGYHFAFLRWLDEILEYARDLEDIRPVFVAEMASASKRMRTCAYFLQDHRGLVPGIGDTDSVAVGYYSPAYRIHQARDNATCLYDSVSGFAVFKGRDRRRDGRYVVFRQPSQLTMRAHAHSDALSVFASWDGEVLLGDSGRFTYTAGSDRHFFQSQLAHSTVVPGRKGGGALTSMHQPTVRSPDDLSSGRAAMWSADLHLAPGAVTRVVTVPAASRDVVVNDAVFVDGAANTAPREANVLWQVGKDVKSIDVVRNGEDGVWSWDLTTRRGTRARLDVSVRKGSPADSASVEVVRGQSAPLLGWYSPRQAVRYPVTAIAVTVRTVDGAYVETRLRVRGR